MKTFKTVSLLAALAFLMLFPSKLAFAKDGDDDDDRDESRRRVLRAELKGDNEVPVISTNADADFRARISRNDDSIEFTLSLERFEGVVSMAHIHLAQPGVNGGVIVFLCGGGGKPACPQAPATVTGTIVAADVLGPTGQGIAPGEFAEFVRQIKRGNTYANVHSDRFPGGEARGKIFATRF